MKNTELFSELISRALSLGAHKASVIETKEILTDKAFRDMCASNACGMYGKCYMCPPDVGDIDALISEIENYKYALVYQTITELEDSFDFEGMIEAKKRTYPLAQSLRYAFADMNIFSVMHLGAGGCGVCDECAKRQGEPCRFPERAMPSLEAYGINVSALAKSAGMKYINGQNTVTYFGAVLFSLDDLDEEITVSVNGESRSVLRGLTLSEIVKGEKPCGGHGKCGKCKVVARGRLSDPCEDEIKLLKADELDSGVRLACLTYALGDCEIQTLERKGVERIVTDGALPEIELAPAFENYGVAIDVGTTTLAARLYDKRAKLLSESSCINPQEAWGADVISRIEAALDGHARELAVAIRTAIDEIINELADAANIDSKEIDGVVITGNTVMLSLLAEQSVEPFSHAPFDAQRLFGEVVFAKALELTNFNEETAVYLAPCISAFVGADTTCAIMATELYRDNGAMLVDIGTNGEIALWNNGRCAVCSTAAGPAFEGVGISMGMRGAEGAIDKVSLQNGELYAHVLGNVVPRGICGSGLVDAVACMLDIGVIGDDGYLEDDEFNVAEPVSLTPRDVRMLQLAKSAICAGIITLSECDSLDLSKISRLYVAGGFGSYLSRENAAKIGLIPRQLSEKMIAVGNAALGGASVLLLDKNARNKAEYLAKNAVTVDLSSNPVFSENYMNAMLLSEI